MKNYIIKLNLNNFNKILFQRNKMGKKSIVNTTKNKKNPKTLIQTKNQAIKNKKNSKKLN